MNCLKNTQKGAELLVEFCAGELEPQQAAEFEKHIQACPDCKRLVDAQRRLWQTLDGWTPPEVSPQFDARLYAGIARAQAAPVRWWRPVISLAAACAVVAFALIVGIPGFRDSGSGIRAEKIDMEQVEKTLEDLDMLTPAAQAPAI